MLSSLEIMICLLLAIVAIMSAILLNNSISRFKALCNGIIERLSPELEHDKSAELCLIIGYGLTLFLSVIGFFIGAV